MAVFPEAEDGELRSSIAKNGSKKNEDIQATDEDRGYSEEASCVVVLCGDVGVVGVVVGEGFAKKGVDYSRSGLEYWNRKKSVEMISDDR